MHLSVTSSLLEWFFAYVHAHLGQGRAVAASQQCLAFISLGGDLDKINDIENKHSYKLDAVF